MKTETELAAAIASLKRGIQELESMKDKIDEPMVRGVKAAVSGLCWVLDDRKGGAPFDRLVECLKQIDRSIARRN